MLQFALWYVTITLLGLLTFPLAYRLFPALADRGYGFSRSLGLLLWGFVFWLLVSYGLARNEIGGLLFALAVLAGLVIWANWDKPETAGNQPVLDWLKENGRLVFSMERLFLVAFAGWAFVRANNPEITTAGGEKWMEEAFINAIMHSPSFPPHDPWLSGYAISYYYFGYVLTAMLAEITGTISSVAHNLMLSLVFSLSIIGSYSLLYNLLSAYWKSAADKLSALLGAFFAPLFLVLMGNVEGFLELLHAYGIGWSDTGTNFWTWLNIKDLNVAPTQPLGWSPRFYFWWRASRVLQDFDLKGNFIEIIDEFPFFSYLLGDLHPHVLAMPFGLLAGGLALNLYLGGFKGETNLAFFKLPVKKSGLALMAVILGGLAFLNTWDFPVYLAVTTGAFLLWLVHERGWSWELVEDFLKFSIPLALVSIILYLPFYVAFSSQAGGVLPNVVFPTRAIYLWIMFGTLFIPLFAFLVSLFGKRPVNWKIGAIFALGMTLVLWLLSTGLGVLASQTDAGRQFITSQGLTTTWDVLREALLRRLQYGGGLLTIVVLLALAAAYLAGTRSSADAEPADDARPVPFVLMLILFGGLLVLAPEFIYLRDLFGSRMNTIFKFYYQAWALWSLAAGFGTVVLIRQLRGLWLGLFSLALGLVLFVGLTYPVLALPNKTNNFDAANPEQRTLDGAAYLATTMPDDYQAFAFMQQVAPGVVAEAVGGSYTEFARVSTYSGQPAVLGWPFHEGQWRGGYSEVGSREDDIKRLYTTASWDEADSIIKMYGIRYIYIGLTERTAYQVNEDKFAQHLAVIYQQGQVTIYQVP